MTPDLPALLLETLCYEHWLRFFFLDDPEPNTPNGADSPNDTGLEMRINVPRSWADQSRQAEPHLFPLLELLNGQTVSLDSARSAVFRHVAALAGSDPDSAAFGDSLFHLLENARFRQKLDLFHGWVQELANGDLTPDGLEGSQDDRQDSAMPFARWWAAWTQWAEAEALRRAPKCPAACAGGNVSTCTSDACSGNACSGNACSGNACSGNACSGTDAEKQD